MWATGNGSGVVRCQKERRSPLPRTRLPLRFWAALALFAGACASMRYTEILRLDAAVRHVRIDSEAGDVVVQVGEGLQVQRAIRGLEAALTLSERVEGDTLYLEARCLPLLPCGADLTVDVPQGVSVKAWVGHGDVRTSGLDRLELDLGTGDADLEVLSALIARVGQGSLRASVPAGADVRLAVADGDATVETPAGDRPLKVQAEREEIQGVAEGLGGGLLELTVPAGVARVLGVTPLADR